MTVMIRQLNVDEYDADVVDQIADIADEKAALAADDGWFINILDGSIRTKRIFPAQLCLIPSCYFPPIKVREAPVRMSVPAGTIYGSV